MKPPKARGKSTKVAGAFAKVTARTKNPGVVKSGPELLQAQLRDKVIQAQMRAMGVEPLKLDTWEPPDAHIDCDKIDY